MLNKIDAMEWKSELPEFREKTAAFFAKELGKNDYKGFSGKYGVYAQKSQEEVMIRLRMPAGRMTKEKLAFVASMIRKHNVKKAHFTTCQTIQLHDLKYDAVCDIMEQALAAGIVTMGGGGDFPRNTMCSPLSGTEAGEYFDVLPYAEAAGEFAMQFINMKKLPRKYKIGFSSSPANVCHATYRDLGFAATPEGTFDVYSAGGLGNNPKFGVKIAEGVDPSEVLYYVEAMRRTFIAYGNYENRGKARSRYMQDAVGGPENYRKAFLEKLAEVKAEGEDLSLSVSPQVIDKTGDGTMAVSDRIRAQKQPGLYTVAWHPIGGHPRVESLCALSDAIAAMEAVELRIAPDETAYIINLTAKEAEKVLSVLPDTAQSLFETSVSCIGASVCQIGLRDSQSLLAACVKAVREANLPDGALPQIHISGCPSSCGTHQTGRIGFRGASKKVDGENRVAFMLYVDGCEKQGAEAMGAELGTITDDRIPEFLVKLGQTVAASGAAYNEWRMANPGLLEKLAETYTA